MFKQRSILYSKLITIWKNTYGCDEQYRFARALYLLYIFEQAYNINTNHGVVSPGHGRDVFDCINVTNHLFINLISEVKLTYSEGCDNQIAVSIST